MKIDLTGAKVGEKFLDGIGQTLEMVMISENKYETDYLAKFDKTGELLLLGKDGKVKALEHCYLAAKRDPRPWLKDLPDADLFSDDVYYIHCTAEGWEFKLFSSGLCSSITLITMPVMTSDQFKGSLITIKDLKVWQVEFKDSPF